MIETTSRQSWLGYLPLARQAALLKDDLLDPVDKLLDDPARVELVRQSLARRYPRSTLTGRPGMAPDRLLRCCVMKHLRDGASGTWSGSYAATWSIGGSPTTTPMRRRISRPSAAPLPC